jgi:hypothetical protein
MLKGISNAKFLLSLSLLLFCAFALASFFFGFAHFESWFKIPPKYLRKEQKHIYGSGSGRDRKNGKKTASS